MLYISPWLRRPTGLGKPTKRFSSDAQDPLNFNEPSRGTRVAQT